MTYRESLRDIEVCLSAQSSKLYHMEFRHLPDLPRYWQSHSGAMHYLQRCGAREETQNLVGENSVGC